MPKVPLKLERMVGLLIPGRCREHVLGDLHERYRSPAQYIGDAMATVPMVVWSSVLRTSCPKLVLMECAVLGVALALAGTAPLLGVVLGVAALRLLDAYSRPEQRTRPGGVAIALGVAFLFFATIQSAANLKTAFGYAVAAVVVWAIRKSVLSEAGFHPAVATLDNIPERAQRFEKLIRKRNLGEYCGAVLVVFLVGIQVTRNGVSGSPAVMLAGVAFVAWYLYRHGTPRETPTGVESADMLRFYRGELARQASLLRNVFWWYLAPMIPGALLGIAASRGASAQIFAASFAAVFILVFGLNQRAVKGLEREIEALDSLERGAQ